MKLRKDEFPVMQFLHYLRILTDIDTHGKPLVRMLDELGEKEKFKAAHEELDRIFWRMHDELFEPNDRRKFDNLAKDQKCILTGIGMGTHSHTTTVWTEDLDEILHMVRVTYCNEHNGYTGECGADQQRTCVFRKPMKSIMTLSVDELEEEKGHCIFADMAWEERKSSEV